MLTNALYECIIYAYKHSAQVWRSAGMVLIVDGAVLSMQLKITAPRTSFLYEWGAMVAK